MAKETLFDKVQVHIQNHPGASPDDIQSAVGCSYATAVFYGRIIRRGFSSQRDYFNSFKKKDTENKPLLSQSDSEQKVEPNNSIHPYFVDKLWDNPIDVDTKISSPFQKSSQMELLFSAPSLEKNLTFLLFPSDGHQAYLKVKEKIEKVLVTSLLQEAEHNKFHVISLSDIGRRATTHQDYIHFDEEFIPTFLEKYVQDSVIQQETITLISGRTQPVYALNTHQQKCIAAIVDTLTISLERKSSFAKEHPSRTKQQKEIKALYALGIPASIITKELGLKKTNVFSITSKMNLPFKKGRGPTYVKTIKNLLADDNLIDIYRRFSFSSPSVFYAYCQTYNLSLPENITPIQSDISIDTLIKQGAYLEQIGASKDKSGSWASQYIIGGGWQFLWQQKRNELQQQEIQQSATYKKTQLRKPRHDLLSILSQHLSLCAEQESWAYKKAVEYFTSLDKRRPSVKPFSSYLTIFQEYEQAQKTDKKLSLKELAIRAGFSSYAGSVNKILRAVNVKPLFGNNTLSPQHKLEAMRRGAELRLSGTDIGYFLDIPLNNFHEFTHRKYGSYSPTAFIEIIYTDMKYRTKNCPLHLSFASQIYEAHDAGFSIEETRKLLPNPQGKGKHDINKIQQILTSRSGIEPTIITLLQQLYNKPELTKPYKINF